MEFKEIFYYSLISLFSLAILYIFLFKTELLVNRWFIGGVVAIVYIMLRQLYEKSKEKWQSKS